MDRGGCLAFLPIFPLATDDTDNLLCLDLSAEAEPVVSSIVLQCFCIRFQFCSTWMVAQMRCGPYLG